MGDGKAGRDGGEYLYLFMLSARATAGCCADSGFFGEALLFAQQRQSQTSVTIT